jgi:flavin reductase (DIM6/NTAB) family NADH-FMN oxidoreductase RutF/DNA-binding IclR family transcriptional regulator
MTEMLAIDPRRFRQVLGNYPTGVTVVTAMDADGKPAGMAVGSFTSVSLDPPLVAFLPDRGSSSFPRIRTATSFCVNVLAADQEDVCRSFATRGGDKFAGVSWSPSPSGAPRLDGAVAWIDCSFHSITDAGDHYLVMGRVRELDGDADSLPLVFFQGGYGQFSPSSLVLVPEPDVISHLRHADLARTEMERIAASTGMECVATAAVGDQLVVVAGAGTPVRDVPRTRVGQRSPFLPPLGTLFVAGSDPAAVEAWLGRADAGAPHGIYREMLDRVTARGCSWALAGGALTEFERAMSHYSDGNRSPEHADRIRQLAAAAAVQFEPPDLHPAERYDVRLASAPVHDANGTVVLLLTLWALPRGLSGHEITALTKELRAGADAVSATIAALGGTP